VVKLVEITVTCHSGHKDEEQPESFTLRNSRFAVSGITDRWYQRYTTPEYPASDYFKVQTESGAEYILKHDLEADKWYLCR
jgi:hypothetical protein